MKTFALISLGCAKNLVNSEQMLYLLDEAGIAAVFGEAPCTHDCSTCHAACASKNGQ